LDWASERERLRDVPDLGRVVTLPRGDRQRIVIDFHPDLKGRKRYLWAFYGEGFESLWVAVAFANGVTDPEFDLQPGDVLVIPPRPLVMQFLARAGRGGT